MTVESKDANAVVCARGVYRAGCAGPNGAVVVRKPVDGLGACTNHFCTKELRPEGEEKLFRSVERLETLEKCRMQAKMGVADIHKSLHAVCNKNTTMQTMVVEPATRKLYLAIGSCPASAGVLKELDLATLFKKQ